MKRVKKLERTKLGILVTYKIFFFTIRREAIKINDRWGWADEDLQGSTYIDHLLITFYCSEVDSYLLNGK
jgi:hypothetical protein